MGMQWVREAVLRKMEAQIHWLYQLAYSDPDLQGKILPQARTAEEAARQVREARIFEEGAHLPSLQASFRGWEGSASRAYFQALALALPEPYRFQKRGRRPAQDRFNCVLNYLYGILYGQVEMVLVQAGLDPHVGIMHADGHNRPSLSFDFIEPYRPWADAVAFRLCLAHALPAEAFDRKDGGLWLNAKGKPVVVEAFFQFLDEVILWKQVWRGRRHHLLLDAQRLAQQVLLMPDA
jgi:CRISPR-associated protein Cas1